LLLEVNPKLSASFFFTPNRKKEKRFSAVGDPSQLDPLRLHLQKNGSSFLVVGGKYPKEVTNHKELLGKKEEEKKEERREKRGKKNRIEKKEERKKLREERRDIERRGKLLTDAAFLFLIRLLNQSSVRTSRCSIRTSNPIR
jgi:hypothetical protein